MTVFIPCLRGTSVRRVASALCIAMSGWLTGCSEHRRMNAEIASAKAEYAGIDPRLSDTHFQSKELDEEHRTLKSHPALKAGTTDFEEELLNLEAESTALRKLKSDLQTDLAALEKELDTYRASSQKQP